MANQLLNRFKAAGMKRIPALEGGVSIAANNPTLQLLKAATLKGFPFHWSMRENNILSDDFMSTAKSKTHLLTYLRYNNWLDKKTLEALMGKPFSDEEAEALTKMDNAATRFDLHKIGLAAAQKGAKAGDKIMAMPVMESHFPAAFSVK
jgi:hypothetical protein